ncbi:MAG: glutathione transferase [Kofleriaceae bacterium]
MADLTLYAESTWVSPWVFHVMVALEELRVPYKLQVMSFPLTAEGRASLQRSAIIGKVPILVHDGIGISESLAITEYLAEQFAPPAHPALLPATPIERARARQLMSYLRTSLMGLRDDRPTTSVFGRPVVKPLGDKAKADASELIRIAERMIQPGQTTLFTSWSIADADLALMMMRLVANQDPVPKHLVDYTHANWDRRSVREYISHLPTTPPE